MQLVAILDQKSPHYRPFFTQSVPEALRQFNLAVTQADSMIAKFPEDFRLVHLGSFDPTTGELVSFERSRDLGGALDVIKQNAAVAQHQSPLPLHSVQQ